MIIDLTLDVKLSLDATLQRLLSTFGSLLVSRLDSLEAKMSQLSDAIAAAKASADSASTSLDAAIGRVQVDVDAFKAQMATMQAKIDELQALVDAGGATPADIQALADLKAELDAHKAKLDALDPTNPATIPTPAAAAAKRH